MGLESYLFLIELDHPVGAQKLNKAFKTLGLELVSSCGSNTSEYREYFHELATEDGIIETHSFLPSNELELSRFYLRFSICSPPKVVGQTFQLLTELNKLFPIRIKDLEALNYLHLGPKADGYIPIDAHIFKQNPDGIAKRTLLLDETREHAVLRGGNATLNYLDRKNWLGRFLGWIFK